jgi:hypothetical protein
MLLWFDVFITLQYQPLLGVSMLMSPLERIEGVSRRVVGVAETQESRPLLSSLSVSATQVVRTRYTLRSLALVTFCSPLLSLSGLLPPGSLLGVRQ